MKLILRHSEDSMYYIKDSQGNLYPKRFSSRRDAASQLSVLGGYMSNYQIVEK